MPYPVTNNCTSKLIVNPGTAADTIPAQSTRSITNPIAAVQLGDTLYNRSGDWVITPGTALVATFNQQTNHVYLTTPQHFEVVYVP